MHMKKVFGDELQYLFEDVRLSTYKNWIFSNDTDCNVKKLAEAGFIFAGNNREPDAVKCFFCNKYLDGWESTDNPWLEHLKHAPKCSFAKLQKSQNSITLNEFLTLRKDYLLKIVDTYCDGMVNISTKECKKVKAQLKK